LERVSTRETQDFNASNGTPSFDDSDLTDIEVDDLPDDLLDDGGYHPSSDRLSGEQHFTDKFSGEQPSIEQAPSGQSFNEQRPVMIYALAEYVTVDGDVGVVDIDNQDQAKEDKEEGDRSIAPRILGPLVRDQFDPDTMPGRVE
jgi:hypothetical protein